MASVQTSIEINVPVDVAYDQWTQLESFDRFMEGIENVQQESDTVVRFTGKVAGKERTWTSKIVEQVPNERIAWQSVEGAENGGTVLFEPVDNERCKVTLMLDHEPEGVVEKMGDATGFFEMRVKSDLENFKKYIESRGRAEGGWRGEIHGGVREA